RILRQHAICKDTVVNFDTGHTKDHPGVVSHGELVTLEATGHLTPVDKSRPRRQWEVRIINPGNKVCRIDYRIVRRGAEAIAGGLRNDKPSLASRLRVLQVRLRLTLTGLSRRRVREIGTFTQGVHVVALRCLQTGTPGLF